MTAVVCSDYLSLEIYPILHDEPQIQVRNLHFYSIIFRYFWGVPVFHRTDRKQITRDDTQQEDTEIAENFDRIWSTSNLCWISIFSYPSLCTLIYLCIYDTNFGQSIRFQSKLQNRSILLCQFLTSIVNTIHTGHTFQTEIPHAEYENLRPFFWCSRLSNYNFWNFMNVYR